TCSNTSSDLQNVVSHDRRKCDFRPDGNGPHGPRSASLMPPTLTQAATPVSLRRLFASASFVGCGDLAVMDATDDSRSSKPGSLFAAIPGTQADGTQFVEDAIARGAKA